MENPHLEHDVPQRPPTPDKTPRIAAFVVSQQAFLVEYTVAGRAHLDRCLDRDAKRQAEVERKQAKALRVAESIERESSTGSSLRSSGIVKRMRRKDGSCPGDTGEEIILSRAQVLHGNKPEKVGIEESENGLRGKSVKEVKQMEMDKENQPPPPSNSKAIPKQEKRKERLDEHKSAKHNVLQDLAKSSAKGKKRKAEVEETASQTSSAKREIGTSLLKMDPLHADKLILQADTNARCVDGKKPLSARPRPNLYIPHRARVPLPRS
jgi:hypothetical protein